MMMIVDDAVMDDQEAWSEDLEDSEVEDVNTHTDLSLVF